MSNNTNVNRSTIHTPSIRMIILRIKTSKKRGMGARRATKFLILKKVLSWWLQDVYFIDCISKMKSDKWWVKFILGHAEPLNSNPSTNAAWRLWYYWPTMIMDCIEFINQCQVCQYHGTFIKQLLEPLYTIAKLWPSTAWDIGIVVSFEKLLLENTDICCPPWSSFLNGSK